MNAVKKLALAVWFGAFVTLFIFFSGLALWVLFLGAVWGVQQLFSHPDAIMPVGAGAIVFVAATIHGYRDKGISG